MPKKLPLCVFAIVLLFGLATGLAAEQTKITFLTWDGGNGLAVIQKVIDQFMATNPGIQVEAISAPDGYDEKVQTMTVSRDTPDVLMCWNTPQYVEAGLMLDITDQVKKDGFDLNKYYPMSIGQATYKGKLYGLPKDATPRMIYYNKKSFDDAKIPYPKDGWTWADFEATVKKLTRGTGTNAKYGFIVPAGFTYQMQGYIWGAGGDEISANGAKSTVNSPQVVDTIKFFKRVYDVSAQSVIENRITNPGQTEFLSGMVAMMDNGSWPLMDILKEKVSFGLVGIPVAKKGDSPKPVWHGSFFAVGAKSKNSDAAYKLVKFFATEGQKTFAEWGIPAYKPVVSELKMAEGPMGPFVKTMDLKTVVPDFTRNPKFFEADAEFQKAIQDILINNADPQKTLDAAAKAMDKILGGT
jgi:multiple sugar transport system substrate-binding protein